MKHIKFILFTCTTLIAINLSAQTITKLSSATSTKTFDITGYDKINVSDDFKLEVTFSNKTAPVSVEANDNIMEYVDVYKEGSTLYFKLKKRLSYTSWRGNLILNATLTTTNINTFYVSSDAKVELMNSLKNSRLALNVKGDGVFKGDLDIGDFTLNAKSDAHMNLSGKIDSMKAYLASDAQLKASNLVVNDLEIELKSDSQAKIQVKNTIDATATSDANLRYYGNPKVLRSKATGDAHIRSM